MMVLLFSTASGQTNSYLEKEKWKSVAMQMLGVGGIGIGAIIAGFGIRNYTAKPIPDTIFWMVNGVNFPSQITFKSKQDIGGKQLMIGIPIALIGAYIFAMNTIKLVDINKKLKITVHGNALAVSYMF
jgi:hypothetical protein